MSSVGLVAASLSGGLTLRAAAPVPVAARLGSLLRDRPGAVAIGRAHLRDAPGAGDRGRLVGLLVASVGGGDDRRLSSASDPELRALVERAVRRDFADGGIVRVHGWLLSRTEVELCVLAALEAPDEADATHT